MTGGVWIGTWEQWYCPDDVNLLDARCCGIIKNSVTYDSMRTLDGRTIARY